MVGDGGAGAAPAVLALDWSAPSTWWPALSAWVLAMGPAWLVGMPLAALVLGAGAYLAVYLLWWGVIRFERQRRLKARAARPRS